MKRILIVGTVPYNPFYTSRAFQSYFGEWDKDKLAQFFSNRDDPLPGFYKTLYQITDEQILKARIKFKKETGVIFNFNDNSETKKHHATLKQTSSIIKKLYKLGTFKTPSIYLLRKALWKEKFWNTEKFNLWLEEFKPEVIFLSFSDDFFILQIAKYIAQKFQIPIISSIGDDYFFNNKKSLSPLYHIYRRSYKKLVSQILEQSASAVFISDRINKKYTDYFNLRGTTIFLTSELTRRPFRPINIYSPKIAYFGNIRLGRNESLVEIAEALYTINPLYKIEIYSNEKSKRYIKTFKNKPNIIFKGSVPYDDVKKITEESDLILIVEGFKEKDVLATKYSLSTKIADALASGVTILAYGSKDTGAMDYISNTNCAPLCTRKDKLILTLRKLIFDENIQKKYYVNASITQKENHNSQKSPLIFRQIVTEAINDKQS